MTSLTQAGSPPRVIRRSLQLGLGVIFLAGLGASPSGAHDVPSIAIGAESVVVRTPLGSEEFTFRSTDPDIVLTEDPVVSGAALLVVGEGMFAGRTPLIRLTGWQGPEGGPYEYTGGEAGIAHAVLGAGELSIEASGSEWPWSPAGEQETVRVHFQVEEQWYCARFSGMDATWNEVGRFEAGAAVVPADFEQCPAVCGNGVIEVGEACDDGNLVETDGCKNTCEIGTCESEAFASTYEAIQNLVFDEESYGVPPLDSETGCSAFGCHHPQNPGAAGNLDLSAAASYDQLLGLDGLGAESTWSTMRRVEPLAPHQSFLYRKLAAKVGVSLQFPLESTEMLPMPRDPGVALHPDHLEAIRLWILNGAPRDTVVEGTQALLGVCLPDAEPQKIPVPAPPPPDPITGDPTGVQLRQPPWPLYGRTPDTQGEDEICMATYYDVSSIVPEWAKVDCVDPWLNTGTNPTNECFAWHRQVLRQDPQSHHSIITIYDGDEADPQAQNPDTLEPWWGPWSRKIDVPGDPCNPLEWADRNVPPAECECKPLEVDPDLGYAPGCSGQIKTDVACLGFGPADGRNLSLGGGGSNQLVLAQQALYDFELADGVFTVMPVRGILHWNSHAFNVSSQDTTLEQYLNVHFATEEDQVAPSEQIFEARWIFAEFVEPYGTAEVCGSYTLPQGARLFQLSSHTHQRGVRWRTWLPPNDQCRPECLGHPTTMSLFGCEPTRLCASGPKQGENCTPSGFDPSFDPDGFCGGPGLCKLLDVCAGPREDTPEYINIEYNDPRNLLYEEPLAFDSPDPRDRTLLFCSEFDNGATSKAPLKLRSTAPSPPPLDLGILVLSPEAVQPLLGGPCSTADYDIHGRPWRWGVRCLEGSLEGRVGELCGGDHAFCGDPAEELCDACPAHGGITTEDEMFILLGNFFVVPEPSQLLLGLAALAGVGLLARRARRH